MAGLSDVNVWMPFLVVLGLALLIFGGFRGRAFVVCVALTLALSETFVLRPLKSSIGRPRPKQTETVRLVQLQKARPKFLTVFKAPRVHYSTQKDLRPAGQGSSFPSAHTANHFVVAIFCLLFFGRWGASYFLVAGLIGYGRIYLGAHWPSDVVGSALLGTAEALLLAALLSWGWRKAGTRWWPAFLARHPRLFGKVARDARPHDRKTSGESSRPLS